MARPPRISVWLRDDQTVTYFLTLCVEDRRSVLDNPAALQAIQTFCRENANWHTIAAIAMPDHFHALVCPLKDREAKITQFSAGLKRFVRRQTRATWKWQEGVFDRLLRRDEFAESKWVYIQENPVRAGLVERWEDWPYLIDYNFCFASVMLSSRNWLASTSAGDWVINS
jgi:REP-associated tyrosine transposase